MQRDMDVVTAEAETLHRKPNMMRAGLIELESFKFLRVLLVEFDDSTRSIISALLRKSGYRVVSVPDGLKAWEILKASPKNIDLVLAEVELPSTSISGFSLLGMIMDDDICRNIPVIMMSPCDSVNTVYKCMLRGAADFLVKPVRKNELRNLWQHVWRRHSGGSLGQCDDKRDFSQKQIEAIDESSSTKNSNHCVKSPKENRDSSDKGSDSQSSCTKPNMEDDTDVKDDGAMLINDNDAEDKSVKLTCEAVSCIPNNYSTSLMQEEGHADARRMSPVNDSTQEIQVGDAYVEIKPFYRNDEQQPKSSKEAMDLIGSFDTHLNVHSTHSKEVDNSTVKNCRSAPGLELSLRRSNFNDNEIQGVAEIQTLNHSNASAFSRYNQRTLYRPVCSEKKNSATLTCNKADATINHTAEIPQHGPISATLPITGLDGAYSGYGAAWPQLVYTSAGPLPVQSPKCVTQQEAIFQMYSSDQSNVKNHDHQQYNRKYTDGIVHQKRLYVEPFDDYRHFSVPSTTQSFTSSLCNSSSSNFNSSGCGSVCDGSNGNESTAPITGASTERGNEMGVIMPDRINGSDTNCSSQREAALHKFRLKRKDRCFDKKVRYQSRKRLAEQRPRVKGQFVRQIPS